MINRILFIVSVALVSSVATAQGSPAAQGPGPDRVRAASDNTKRVAHSQPAALGRLRATSRESATTLLRGFRQSGARPSSEKLRFDVPATKDVYNPTRPFMSGGRRVIAARVESRDSETDSEVVFFEQRGPRWVPVVGGPRLSMQDPFVSRIGGELVLGGVEVTKAQDGSIAYRTVFYRGATIETLHRFSAGPAGMKDIRLTQLPDGRVFVLTRPQGAKGGRGKIGYTIVADLEALTPEAIARAPLITGQFGNGDWGGANEIHVLGGDRVGVLGHIARFDKAGGRHYYPVSFEIRLQSGSVSPMKILVERKNLESGVSKRADLRDVVFSGGLERRRDGTATLYVGAGDAEVHRVRIRDPFAPATPLSK